MDEIQKDIIKLSAMVISAYQGNEIDFDKLDEILDKYKLNFNEDGVIDVI